MNMYIAQAKNGNFEVVKDLGVIDPRSAWTAGISKGLR